jgi:hypothetical protein
LCELHEVHLLGLQLAGQEREAAVDELACSQAKVVVRGRSSIDLKSEWQAQGPAQAEEAQAEGPELAWAEELFLHLKLHQQTQYRQCS